MEADAHHQEERFINMNSSLTSFGYSDISSAANPSSIPAHLMSQIQTIESNPDQMFNLTTNMEMIGYFPPANDDQSSMVVTQDHSNSWQENHRLLLDDSSLRCVFSGEGNDQRTSQGLSLSLSSINPSTGFESFDLRHNSSTTPTAHHAEDHQMRYLASTSGEGYYGKSLQRIQPGEHQMISDGFLGKVSNLHIRQHELHDQFQLIRNSKYLKPAQELLNEFCSLGSKQSERHHYLLQKKASKQKVHGDDHQWDHNEHASTTSNNRESSRNHNLYSLERLELQKRKAQLLSMLEEVDRRYKHYCDQMKAVVSSFEAAAGIGAAAVYTALASKAMSRHFKCLKDGIVEQIQATKKAMGENDDQVALGTTRGETPRLRLLDQTLRQQKAFQQLNMMESHPWRPQRGLPERSVSVLRAWMFEHFLHPYPTDVDKHILARQTGLSRSQVSNWFINARVRLWKPMVEEMYMEETKEELAENTNNNLASSSGSLLNSGAHHEFEDEKPTPNELIRIDSDCLSSIMNHNNSHDKNEAAASRHAHSHIMQHLSTSLHPFGAAYNNNNGAIELDFSSYNPSQNFGPPIGSGVSLTLGLQQHGEGGGVSLAFPSSAGGGGVSSHGSMFYGSSGRGSMDECQTMQYSSVMDGDDQGQNLPYRNLLGAQLLHDLAGQ